MKSSKSPENKEVTPSKKKLTQARLPFKLITDVSPKPAQQQTRKRKLSATPEPVTKVGKICKENGLTDDPVVISDDECIQEQVEHKDEKPKMNPFVKLVDTAWKKKLQKSKKKSGKKKSKDVPNGDVVSNVSVECDEVMEVDAPSELPEKPDSTESATDADTTKLQKQKQTTHESDQNENEISPKKNVKEIIVLEESKNSVVNVNNLHINKTPDLETELDVNIQDTESDNLKSESNINVKEPNVKDLGKMTESDTKIEAKKLKEDKSDKSLVGSSEDKTICNKLTPKRSTRNQTKLEERNDLNSSNCKLNESVSSNPSTPKRSRDSSVTNSHGNDSMNDSNLTPKQLQKKLESAKKREEREKEKQEREKKRQQEKEERAKIKQEKEEQKKKEREEKEEQKRKEKEEKERQKELEKKLREEKEDLKRKEREEKEEQRRKEKEAREEEKRKKQEAIELEKQEQELKKKKAAEAFVNFFVPKQKVEKDQIADAPVSKNSMLSSFTIKVDMRLAPTIRVNLNDDRRQNLDELMEQQNTDMSYLKNLKDGTFKPTTSGRTWPLDDKDDDDVMIVEDELPPMSGAGEIITCEPAVREKLRPKLLSFHENRRPPYWGTWRKTSASVKPRKPFGQDEKQIDYEADSDEEWEEEQEGESIDGSAAGSDDEQDADEYEVDNEVFVPHGYLSDEEATVGEDDVLSLSPETQKARLKHLEDEFESEMKKPTEKLKPRLYGLLWENSEGGKPEQCVDALWNYFGKLAMVMNDPTPLLQPSKEPEEAEKKKVKKKKAQDGEKESPKVEKKKKSKAENKEVKPKAETKKVTADVKNQPGINTFLTKIKTS